MSIVTAILGAIGLFDAVGLLAWLQARTMTDDEIAAYVKSFDDFLGC